LYSFAVSVAACFVVESVYKNTAGNYYCAYRCYALYCPCWLFLLGSFRIVYGILLGLSAVGFSITSSGFREHPVIMHNVIVIIVIFFIYQFEDDNYNNSKNIVRIQSNLL